MSPDERLVWHAEDSPCCCPCATWRGLRLACRVDDSSIELRLWSVTDATGKVIAEGRCNRWSVKSMMVNEAAKALKAQRMGGEE